MAIAKKSNATLTFVSVLDADGTKLHRLSIAPAVQHAGTHEVVPDAGAGSHIEIDLARVILAQAGRHVLVMHQQAAFLLGERLRLHKGHPRSCAADTVKENQGREDVLILPDDGAFRCSGHTGGVGAGRNREEGGPLGADRPA